MSKLINIKELLRVYSLMDKKKLQYFVSIIITGLCMPCMQIIFAFAYKNTVNAIEFKNYSMFVNACLLFLFALIIQCAIEPLANYYNGCMVTRTIYSIRIKAFRHFVQLLIDYHEKQNSGGNIVKLTTNIDSFEPVYRGAFRNIMQSIFYGVGAFISMMYINHRLALYSLLFSAFALIVNSSFSKLMRRLSRISQHQKSMITQALINTFTGGQTAKMFNKEFLMAKNFDSANKNLFDTSMTITKKTIQRNGLNYIVSMLSKIGILLLGLNMAINNKLDIGSVVGIIALQDGVTNMFISIGGFFTGLQSHLAGIERVFEVLDTPVEDLKYSPEGNKEREAFMGIHVEGLSFAYGDNAVLCDISLTVRTGESIGIIGVSGGGKSTLLKLLSGLYTSQSGVIEVEGAATAADIRRNVAMVMQSSMLFPASIKENITCGHPMSDETINRACEAAQLSEWIAALPDGMDTFVGERGGKVSGGQAQRIAIARAIAKDAPVVLLDEATSALDGGTGSAVLSALANLTKGRTVVSVSHRPEALTGCDRIYRLEGGRLYDVRLF